MTSGILGPRAWSERRTATAAGLVALALVATVVLWRFPVQGQAYLAADVLPLYVPYRTGPTPYPKNLLIVDPVLFECPCEGNDSALLHAGAPLPRWTPGLATGEPTLGRADYLPYRWALAWLPPWVAHDTLVLFHLYLALAGTFLLARVRGASIGAALTAASVWGLSGGVSVWLELEYWTIAFSWIPWSLLGVELALRSDQRWLVLSGLALGASILGGFVQIAELGFGLTVVHALVVGAGPFKRRVVAATIPVVLGLGLGSLQLMPAVVALGESQRTRIPFERYFRDTASLNLRRVALIVAPDVLGDPASDTFEERTTANYLTDAMPGEWYANPQEIRFSPGIVALGLTLAGATRRRNLGLTLIALGILLIPFRTPLAWLVWRFVPGFGATSPTRVLAGLPLVLALLAAEGWTELQNGSTRLRGAFFAILACPVALALARVNPAVGLLARPLLKPTLLAIAAAAITLRAMRATSASTEGKPARWPRWARAGLLALVLLDLVEATVHYNPHAPPALLEPPAAAVARIRELTGSGRYLADRAVPPDVLLGHGFRNIGSYGSLHLRRYARLVDALESPKKSPGPSFKNVLWAAGIPPCWRDALDVRAVLVDPSIGPAVPQGLVEVESGGLARSLYRNPTAVSRARLFSVREATICRNEDEALVVATAESFDPRSHLVIERAQDELPSSSDSASDVTGRARGTTEIARDDPEEVQVLVRGATAPCYLLLTDAFAAGWTATLDGQPAEILPADVAFRAVVVPAGDHEVEFRYSAPGRAWAAWITGSTILALLAFVGLAAGPKAQDHVR